MSARRRRTGDQTACARCGQDIEWHGRAVGWIDRGAGRQCLPYADRATHEIVKPRPGLKHQPAPGR